MFHIFGSPRSGTTLLAQSLDAHPDILVPDETNLVMPVAFLFNGVRDPATGAALIADFLAAAQGFRSLAEYAGAERVREAVLAAPYDLAEILHAAFDVAARGAGKRVAGDKSPNDIMYLRAFVEGRGVGPRTKVIHIVRDVRDVLSSLLEQPWAPPDLHRYFPRIWGASNLYLADAAAEFPDRYRLVKYEELVRDPAQHLASLCDFLGVAFDARGLGPQARHPRYAAMPHHQRLFEPISTARVGRFESTLPAPVVDACLRQAGEAMERFGYLPPPSSR